MRDIVLQDWESEMWKIPNVKVNHSEYTGHPAQFPIELVQRLALALTNKDDAVLYPYGGVGSSARDEGYNNITLERVRSMMNGTLKIRKILPGYMFPQAEKRFQKYRRIG